MSALAPELSFQGLKFLERFEGFRDTLYCDPAGHCTIGFGHLVHRGKVGTNPVEERPFARGISQVDAVALLLTDVKVVERALAVLVTVPLSQPQIDALISFVYNVGVAAFEESTLLRRLNDGLLDTIPHELARWNKAGHTTVVGLVRRRAAEGKLFAEGTYV